MSKQPTWAIIPDYTRLDRSLALAERYGAAFEYNDFFLPAVYTDPAEVARRMDAYRALPRDRTRDTLHGVFFDIAFGSADRHIRAYSRELVEGSVAAAAALEIRGAVFHTGLLPGLDYGDYRTAWLDAAEAVFRPLAERYPTVDIYMENTFERSPALFSLLMERMADVPNFALALDYAHAALTPTPVSEWVAALAPHIRHSHLNDNDLLHDLHAVPGEGKLELASFLATAERHGVDVPILLELTGTARQERALDYMTALCAKEGGAT